MERGLSFKTCCCFQVCYYPRGERVNSVLFYVFNLTHLDSLRDTYHTYTSAAVCEPMLSVQFFLTVSVQFTPLGSAIPLTNTAPVLFLEIYLLTE